MTDLPTRSKDVIVSTFAAGVQGRINAFANFALGSVFLAIGESVAGVYLWLQNIILQVLARTRAATSDGADLETWMSDYGLSRLGARTATGLVTFSRYTAATSAPVIPVGASVQTGDGSQKFTVYADPTNGAYSGAQAGYVLLAGAASVNVPVQAVSAGTGGNVAAGAISLIGSAVPGVDTVSNPAALTNGVDAESDDDFRTRFQAFIASLSKATNGAIGYAIISLQQGLRYRILENVHPDGTADNGFVTVFVDDGSGNPSSDLVAMAAAAVDAVRASGVRVAVFGASTLTAIVQMTVQIDPTYYAPDVVANVTAALSVYINALPLGAKLRYTRLEQLAYDASPGVVNVTNVILNGGTGDLAPTLGQTVKVGSLVVNQAV